MVRVMLGLKPEFARRLGGTSPHNSPGYICGIALGPQGAMVFSRTRRTRVRKYDLDGEYLETILPPSANLPPEKLEGMGYVEYEPGKFAVHGPVARETVADRGDIFGLEEEQPGKLLHIVAGVNARDVQFVAGILDSLPDLLTAVIHPLVVCCHFLPHKFSRLIRFTMTLQMMSFSVGLLSAINNVSATRALSARRLPPSAR